MKIVSKPVNTVKKFKRDFKSRLNPLIHSTAPNLALKGKVQKRRLSIALSPSTKAQGSVLSRVEGLSKPRAKARGASNGLICCLVNINES